MKQASLFVALIALASPSGAGETVAPAAARFASRDSRAVPDFQKHVVPLLGSLGCNSAKCHGSFQGRAGLRLSLFGFDFAGDHAALVAAATTEEGSRLSVAAPDHSLILLKATGRTEHEGGERLEQGSWRHHLLLRWIEAGAEGVQGVEAEAEEPLSDDDKFFVNRIRPILENNCYECHGFAARKGGLQLKSRELLLAGGDSGPAIVSGDPASSLLVEAVKHAGPDLKMPPNRKLKRQEIADLEAWVRRGAPWPADSSRRRRHAGKVLRRLHCEPVEILFRGPGERVPLKVVAEWESGEREDVTCLTRFRTNNDLVVTVDADGLATATQPGDTHVVALYDNGVAAIPVMQPLRQRPGLPAAASAVAHPIDRRVNAKLAKLGIVPSALCTDAEFLRRASIDITGSLPTPEEVRSFLADPSRDKRSRMIDELLTRPAYAAWWANKLCDFTGCSPTAFGEQTGLEVGQGYATQWYDWIFRRIADNVPYDRLVEGIVLAESRLPGQTAAEYAAEMSSYVRRESPADFAARKTMPHYWTRDTVSEDKDKALAFAHSFLGIQLQCAECHKHPFDKWTQGDFNEFTRFFENVTSRGRIGFPAFAAAQRGEIVGWPEMSVAKTNETELALLRSGEVRIAAGTDPRKPLMDWMRRKNNPWFARTFVNRVWAGYFHVGIVDPPDQFTPANPPSNPQLLDWLTAGFIESGYDMKWLHRQIATSDAYQRSWRPNDTNRRDRRNFSRAIPRRIPAEVIYDAMKQATAATDELVAVRTNLKRRATGHLSMRMAGTHALKVFGKPERAINCDCERVNEPTLLQAVFVQNDPLVRMRIADSQWIIDIEDAEEEGRPFDRDSLVSHVWLRTVGREPRESERQRAMAHLSAADSTAEGIRDLMWAMFNTKEFLLNH